MLLNVLSRRGDGCRAMQRLIRDCHEPEGSKPAHRRRGWQLFRALVSRGIVEFVPRTPDGAKLRVNVDLQDDFSMDQALSLYLLETIPLLDPDSPDYALDLLTLVESILENPELILRRQLDRIKDRAVAEMKADGVEYEQRMEELDKLEYPKPLRDFVYDTFNAFADRHPWVGEENIRPKSIAREMFENYKSFAEYVLEYDLQRSEGLLLRHLNSVYKVLSQTVPDSRRPTRCWRSSGTSRRMVRGVDASLADEWERMRDPLYTPLALSPGAGAGARPPRRGGALRCHPGRARVHRGHPRADLHRAAGLVPRRRRRRGGGDGPSAERRIARWSPGRRPACGRRWMPTSRSTSRCASIPKRATCATPMSLRRRISRSGACSRCWSIPRW